MSEDDTVPEDVAREELGEIIEELAGVERRLVAIHGSLPKASLAEGSADDDVDVATEIRSVIDCVLTDSVRPAIRDLQAAARYRGSREGKAPGPEGS